MAQVNLEEWSVKANDVMDISLYTKAEKGQTKVNSLCKFQPTWTYPIVGEQETIFGYKGLKIHLQYNASDMRPHLSSTKTAKLPEELESDDFEVHEISELFEDFLPPSAFASKPEFVKAVQNTSDDWHPPGELIRMFEDDEGSSYEVWKGSLADPLVLALVKRIQILVSLFIEAGTPIATESTEEREADPLSRWTIFLLYHKRPRKEMPGKFTYVFAGYCTVYRFFIFHLTASGSRTAGDLELPMGNLSFTDFPCRSRISQFIIIEPFQHKGNGQRLYSTIYQTLLEDPNTIEITIEDPNEAFDVLRDRADLKFLRKQPEFNDIEINTSVTLPAKGRLPNNIIDKKALEIVRHKYKIAPRQFSRLTEMHLLSKLPDSVRPDLAAEVQGKGNKSASKADEYVYRLWKLVAKSRINAQNKEQLATLEPSERIQALQETVGSVELEYALLLSMIDQRKDVQASSKKRKLSKGAEQVKETPTGKKRRLAEKAEEAGDGGDENDGEEDGKNDESDKAVTENEDMPDHGGDGHFDRGEELTPQQKFVEDMPDSPEVDLLSD
ncbi:unnamed protein product [Discula destructiva]